ncbi:hypothetical protein Tco_0135878, partial [Tanacetum coccineum]
MLPDIFPLRHNFGGVTANEMWIAIERLQQGESLNVQDVKTNLFWEFGKFTSRDGESMESYYSRQKLFQVPKEVLDGLSRRVPTSLVVRGPSLTKDVRGLNCCAQLEVEHLDQNAAECVDERAALANLIANLTLDMEENKTVQKQLKKANASLTQELKECKTNLDESSRALGEATSSRDS